MIWPGGIESDLNDIQIFFFGSLVWKGDEEQNHGKQHW